MSFRRDGLAIGIILRGGEKMTWTSGVISYRVQLADENKAIINLPVNKMWEIQKKEYERKSGKNVYALKVFFEHSTAKIYHYKEEFDRDADYERLAEVLMHNGSAD